MIETEPRIQIECQVMEPTSWYKPRKIRWKGIRNFDINHWVDITDQSMLPQTSNFILQTDIVFDNKETEQSYSECKNLLMEEIPQNFRSREVQWKMIIPNAFLSRKIYIAQNYKFLYVMNLIAKLFLISWLLKIILPKLALRFSRRFTIKKMVSKHQYPVLTKAL